MKRNREAERQISFTIARNLRNILNERGLTQADFARMAGTQEPTVNRHLVVDDTPTNRTFQRCPTVPLLVRYCEALHVPIDDILGRSHSKQWVDPDIQLFFEEYYGSLTPEMRSWFRHTIEMLRRQALEDQQRKAQPEDAKKAKIAR